MYIYILILIEKTVAMSHCSENLLGPGGAGGQGVSNDPPDGGRVYLNTTNGAGPIDGRLGAVSYTHLTLPTNREV